LRRSFGHLDVNDVHYANDEGDPHERAKYYKNDPLGGFSIILLFLLFILVRLDVTLLRRRYRLTCLTGCAFRTRWPSQRVETVDRPFIFVFIVVFILPRVIVLIIVFIIVFTLVFTIVFVVLIMVFIVVFIVVFILVFIVVFFFFPLVTVVFLMVHITFTLLMLLMMVFIVVSFFFLVTVVFLMVPATFALLMLHMMVFFFLFCAYMMDHMMDLLLIASNVSALFASVSMTEILLLLPMSVCPHRTPPILHRDPRCFSMLPCKLLGWWSMWGHARPAWWSFMRPI